MTEKKVFAVALVAKIPPGEHRIIQIGQRELGIFNIDGEFYALPSLCIHQLGPLCKGKVSGTLLSSSETDWKLQWSDEGQIVTCPWHGLEYHIKTGQCLAFPEIRLRTYEVWVEDETIKVLLQKKLKSGDASNLGIIVQRGKRSCGSTRGRIIGIITEVSMQCKDSCNGLIAAVPDETLTATLRSLPNRSHRTRILRGLV